MTKSYNQDRAEQLVPLLEAITREMVERTRNVRVLQRQLREYYGRDGQSTTELNLRAELADHLREIRLARTELDKLGCIVDETDLTRVYIPGSDGKLDHGYSWHAGECKVRQRAGEGVSEAPAP